MIHALLRFVLCGVVLGFAGLAHGQSRDTTRTAAPDSMSVTLPGVTVEAIRDAETTATAPFSVTVERRSPAEMAFTPSLSLDDVLMPLSGVWVNDRHHLALGERISVRGVGYRSNFGVRGIQVVLDGVPLTLPDGQAFLDVVDPAVVRRVELVRTPASVFWGNGSGGVLFLSTPPERPEPMARVRLQGGRYGRVQGLLEGASSAGPWRVHGYASGRRQDGFRAHSEGYRLNAGFNAARPLGPQTTLRVTAAGDVQDTENPSSLTLEQFRDDPSQARDAFVDVDAGKQSGQGQLGVSVDHAFGGASLSATVYSLYRSLDNPLSFGYVSYDRHSTGTRLTLRRTVGRLQGGVGVDAGFQSDDRIEYAETIDGEPGDAVALDQTETVLSASAFAYTRLNVTERLALTSGVRVDGLRFDADDALTSDGDQSGDRTFSAWSPSAGLAYDLGPALVFAHYSTAFETPTASELSNRPNRIGGGFNASVDPQRTRGIEGGVRGTLPSARLQFDVALFRLDVDDQITSFEDTLGQEVYRNLGENRHSGVEASLTWRPTATWEVLARYTGSRFVIDRADDASLEGNRVPGIPAHRGYVHVQAERGGWWARVASEMVPDYYVDDANRDEAPGYVLLNLHLGRRLTVDDTTVRAFVAAENLLDERYAGSVVINAFGGRYYEPAPGFTYSAGLTVEL